jgi:hypothetical protein
MDVYHTLGLWLQVKNLFMQIKFMWYPLKEAFLELSGTSLESLLNDCEKIRDYISGTGRYRCDVSGTFHSESGKGSCVISVYPVTAQDALDLTDEVSGIFRSDMKFRLRNHIPRKLLATDRN